MIAGIKKIIFNTEDKKVISIVVLKLFKCLAVVPFFIGVLYIVDELLPQKQQTDVITGFSGEVMRSRTGKAVISEYIVKTQRHVVTLNKTAFDDFNYGDSVVVSVSPLLGDVKYIRNSQAELKIIKSGVFHSGIWLAVLPFLFLSVFPVFLLRVNTNRYLYYWILIQTVLSVMVLSDTLCHWRIL